MEPEYAFPRARPQVYHPATPRAALSPVPRLAGPALPLPAAPPARASEPSHAVTLPAGVPSRPSSRLWLTSQEGLSGSLATARSLRAARRDLKEGCCLLTIITPRSGNIVLEASISSTVAELMQQLQSAGEARGLSGDDLPHAYGGTQDACSSARATSGRLLRKGMPLRPGLTLHAAGVQNGDTLRLLPALRSSRAGHVSRAPRGLLMTPGNKPWAPKLARGPREPLALEMDAPYCANLRDRDLIPHPALPMPT